MKIVINDTKVTLFNAKLISSLNVEYQFASFRTQYVTPLKSKLHIMYSAKLKMIILFLTYSFKIDYFIFDL